MSHHHLREQPQQQSEQEEEQEEFRNVIEQLRQYRRYAMTKNHLRLHYYQALPAHHQEILAEQPILIQRAEECILKNAEFLELLAANFQIFSSQASFLQSLHPFNHSLGHASLHWRYWGKSPG